MNDQARVLQLVKRLSLGLQRAQNLVPVVVGLGFGNVLTTFHVSGGLQKFDSSGKTNVGGELVGVCWGRRLDQVLCLGHVCAVIAVSESPTSSAGFVCVCVVKRLN